MDQRDVTKQQPIGYWLKRADEVITEHVDRVLNIVYQAGTITRGGVFDTMQTFIINTRQLDEIIDEFVKERWLAKAGEGDGAQLTLTERVRPSAKPSSSCRVR
jgi:hypothetical protein